MAAPGGKENRKLRLALISGGTSGEREISLKGGDRVFHALDPERYAVVRYDTATDLGRLAAEAGAIDAALVILHGTNGEDGTVQGYLDLLNIPYQCTGVMGSAIAMNKLVSKFFYEKAGIPVPGYIAMEMESKGEADAELCIERLGLPLVIKPASGGSSIGMSIVRSRESFFPAIEKAFLHDNVVFAEQYLTGTEITGGVLGNAHPEALPIVEIIPKNGYEFFDYKAKYTPGETLEICPARISDALTQKAREIALAAHRALFCSGCSRTDMIIHDNRIYVLETNTIPGMTENSLLPLAAAQAGMSYSQLLERLIELALEKKKPVAV
ncbi:MAG: D-alanine--D-alanine ligase [Desulfosalsimonadaceae bacterium]